MAGPEPPISEVLPQLRTALARHARLVLQAPPGAGKTTRVPPALLDATWLGDRRIVLLEPRRLAARAAAEFMAAQRGEAVGGTVGYRIRFEARVSAHTRIEVVTEGILTRMLQDDPELGGVGAIVFDEFHERHLAGDLGAVLALDVQDSLRPDLRIIVMSATLAGGRVAGWLDAPVVRSTGRAYPVTIEYPPASRGEGAAGQLRRTVQQALADTAGDVLVFLPGRREIAEAQRMLGRPLAPPAGRDAADERSVSRRDPESSSKAGRRDREGVPPRGTADAVAGRAAIEVLPLHGDLALAAQRAALAPAEPGTRRVILATNVAESSVTVPGVTAVVDTGLAREPRFDPNSGFTRLATVAISQASADQRAGRAGRTAAGIAYRLWPQSRRLDPARTAEIKQAELSGLALELAAWGADPVALRWLDAPPAGALAAGRALLQDLGALDAGFRITPLGRRMLALGTDPRLAAAALRAPAALRPLASDLLALLEARSPLRGGFNDDVRTRLDALHRFRDGGPRAARGADAGTLAAIEQAARGWQRRLGIRYGASGAPDALAVGNLLLRAFPDRAARQDDRDPLRYRLANGRGVRLHPESTLFGERWLVIVEARFDERDSLVLAAAPFDEALLQHELGAWVTVQRVVALNPQDVVEAFEETRFGDLVLERRAVPVAADDALGALLAAVRKRGLAALPWPAAVLRLRARIAWLALALPAAGLPDVSDAALLGSLEAWLAPALANHRKLGSVPAARLSEAFGSLLDWPRRKLVDEAAPDALWVPSGRTLKLDYPLTGADTTGPLHPPAESASPQVPSPVLAVKLQELFGLAETPRVARGRVPVTLHLLSPAGRPIQVTQDLRGFWNHTYPEVRRELQGRYPRHPWPEDPWRAMPTHRTKPRR